MFVKGVQRVNNVLLSSLLILSSIMLSNLVLYGMRRREIPGVFVFSILMLAMIIHSVGYALELLSNTLEHMYFWIRIEYLGAAFYSFLIMFFAREYADEKRFANKYLLTLLLTINFTTLVLVYTNSYHGLYYSSMGIDSSLGFPILAVKKGIWYFVQIISLYFSILYSVIIFSIKLKRARGDYRKKVAYMLIGALIPMITLFVYLLGLGPVYIDLTPFSYFLMTLFIVIGLLRYDMLALTPITYEMVFNSIGEAVLVIDKDEILLSFNRASKEFFPSLEKLKAGESVHLVEELKEYNFSLKPPIYEIHGKLLNFKVNKIKTNGVSIFVINDITESERVKKQLEILATHDALTGLYNRRFFMEHMEKAGLKGVLAMIDIDHFKKINDTYGHHEGDKVLSYFGESIINFFPKQLSCRYGGEEFVIFIENVDLMEADRQIESLREKINQVEGGISITFSAGLAEYQHGTISESLQRADQKLYEAKENGRNQTCFEHYEGIEDRK